jgi:hypothetical protein
MVAGYPGGVAPAQYFPSGTPPQEAFTLAEIVMQVRGQPSVLQVLGSPHAIHVRPALGVQSRGNQVIHVRPTRDTVDV